ncbi:hypothetical protein EDEG_02677 [Edhazardia aedis USNM 41457]|uniref:Uncharacterized protein n=1 Tax=Edhazardia aedis (strain USNM 41457) TaxID=1003232 RepID=J9DJZ0_EDHAE|nr:hypothetical protein EDEG_02677 [Edhazardia aedis USNM 41457]|eukprot:EJW02935.1 hypothetical protein EDEG_02677 [Edhazardia aedis USNM 41457]
MHLLHFLNFFHSGQNILIYILMKKIDQLKKKRVTEAYLLSFSYHRVAFGQIIYSNNNNSILVRTSKIVTISVEVCNFCTRCSHLSTIYISNSLCFLKANEIFQT